MGGCHLLRWRTWEEEQVWRKSNEFSFIVFGGALEMPPDIRLEIQTQVIRAHAVPEAAG